jgi:chromosome segregation ATPase
MPYKFTILLCAAILCCGILTGCGSDEESAVDTQEIDSLKVEVAQAGILLQKSRAECDELTATLSEQTEKLAKVQADYNTLLAERDALQARLNLASQTQDSTARQSQDVQRTIEQLQQQLQEKTDEAQELQNYNRELNVTVERLQNQPRPEEQPQEQPQEQPVQ